MPVLFFARLLLESASAAEPSSRVDFNFQIRPLLSDRCFACHGPDEKARKGKLRLDTREGMLKPLEEGWAVVKPGDTGKSELIRRIDSTDPDEMMPPPKSNLKLSGEEKTLLKRWITEGAESKGHWSFIPVRAVAVPKPENTAWVRNPIDAFVATRLEREGIQPSSEASRETLIRRVALDLTGLPPSEAEIDAFLTDGSIDAYERVIGRCLDSPAYGERMAMDWLDLARYADTYGYQADVERDMAPWRDWVIRMFNGNLPYDQFILRQVAGDLLPNPTSDQELATAFHRLHRQTNEGGSIEEEFRTEYVADRVHTFGTAFLGLTLECARCHDHKFDPILQRDYYSLFAFFNNIDESGLYSHFTQATPTPTLLLWPDEWQSGRALIHLRLEMAEERLKRVEQETGPAFRRWLRKDGKVQMPQPIARFRFETIVSNATPDSVTGKDLGRLVEGPKLAPGYDGNALLFSGDNELVCRGITEFTRADPFSFSLWLQPTEKQDRAVILHRSRAWTDSGSRGYELVLEQGRPFFGLIHFWPGNAIAVRAKQALPLNEWSHLAVTYDGSSRAAGIRLFQNGRPIEIEVVRDNLYRDIVHRSSWGDADAGNINLTLAGRFRDSGFKGGLIDDFQVFDVCLTEPEVKLVVREPPLTRPSVTLSPTVEGRGQGEGWPQRFLATKRDANVVGATHKPGGGPCEAAADVDPSKSADAKEGLFRYFLARHHAPYGAALAQLNQARDSENELINNVREIMVMRELPERRPTHLLKRGAYDAPADIVQPDTPKSIMPFPSDLPRNRLGLAQWLISRQNPLTARVVVNRIWRMHFGRGLVATQEDFGSQGRLPTHPELLEWLAGWFMDHGWDLKALQRLMVTSATYRQSSEASRDLQERDPENHLLARGPKHRLIPEQIRDSALAASGLLNRTIGGPSVKPYQPAGLWEQSGTGKTYAQDKGDKLYRRSLYTFWRRTAPPPSMLTFDATSREVCTAKREVTSTPLQALVLLDDPQFVEAARALGERLLKEFPNDLNARIRGAFRALTGRAPDERELEILRRLFDEQRTQFANRPESAEKLLRIGESPWDQSLPRAEFAATTLLVSAVMNYDEFVMER